VSTHSKKYKGKGAWSKGSWKEAHEYTEKEKHRGTEEKGVTQRIDSLGVEKAGAKATTAWFLAYCPLFPYF
jgi:hypothetical protein